MIQPRGRNVKNTTNKDLEQSNLKQNSSNLYKSTNDIKAKLISYRNITKLRVGKKEIFLGIWKSLSFLLA